ncbi:reverse transcriptase domain-containing protein [Tanacetum coccineum]
MEKGSSVGGNSGGKPLKFILKKSSYTPPNNIAAAVAVNDTIVGNATTGCRPSNAATARVEHGINRTTNKGNPKDYDGVRDVLEPVVNVDEAEYPTLDSANVGANMANMAHTKVSTNDMFGVSNVTPDIDEIGEFTIGNMPSGADSCTGHGNGNQATTVGFNLPHATPFSFANILNSEHYCKKLNFRTLVNDEHLESYDFVLPKLAVDSVKNRFGQVLERGPWMIRNSPIILNKWSSSSTLKKDVVTKVPVWVKLHKVPLLAYSEDGLSLIATQIGTPIMLDTFTSSMCIESWGRISFACALVEISSDKDLKKEVTMAVPNEDGTSYTREIISVEYEWQPLRCLECKIFGHSFDKCPNIVRDPVTSTNMDTTSDGFTEVTRKKNKGTKADQQARLRPNDGIRLNKPKPNFYWQKKGTYKSRADLATKGQIGVNEHTPSTWNEEFESDDEVDEVIFPEGNKLDDQFDIRLKGRVRK